MDDAIATGAAARWSAARPVLAGGLLAGALDISAAIVIYAPRGVPPGRVLQSVASGLLGASAFRGGPATAALGLLLHFSIATVVAAVYYAASRKLAVLTRRPFLCGTLYGIGVYAVMNFLVVPLSAAPRRPFAPGMAALMVAVHIACVGVPVALAVRRYAGRG
jgi:hypothetical protein